MIYNRGVLSWEERYRWFIFGCMERFSFWLEFSEELASYCHVCVYVSMLACCIVGNDLSNSDGVINGFI